jgi:electron transfer flavoprotein beta subunit
VRYVVFLKQVPAASELPWDPKTGQLRREAAPGMMDPAARAALEAALRLQEAHGGQVLAVTMGPPQAEEVLRQALALGADRGFLLSDPRLSGADTVATSYTLARALGAVCPDYDLLLLGSRSADSETGQVGPHLAEELGLPAAAYVEELELAGRTLTASRMSDGFWETLEMDLPALVTVTPRGFAPRPVPLVGVEPAFGGGGVFVLDAGELRADLEHVGLKGSAGLIRRVRPAQARESGVLIQGSAKAAVEELLERFGRRLGGLAGRDLAGEGR